MTESYRMWASASFVGVLIIIGMPLWWKTTEVYRVSLPYDKISSFDTLSHSITTELIVMANDDQTASEIISLVEKTFEQYDVLKLKIKKSVVPEKLRRALDSVTEDVEAMEEVAATFDLKKPNTFYVVQRKSLLQQAWLGTERVMFFRDAKAASTLATALSRWVYNVATMVGARAVSPDAARRTRFPPSDKYHVVLSVVHSSPDLLDVQFDAAQAVEDYVGSFVDELSTLHNFTLKSQWLHLLDFDFQAKEVKDASKYGRHFAVHQDRLSLLLTRLEERAATHVSEVDTVKLALYVTPCDAAPLIIYDTTGKPISTPVQAFMSPKWGGVVLGSPPAEACGSPRPVYEPSPRVIMGAFIAQLRTLLGIEDMESISDAYLEPLRSVSPRSWEVDTLLRIRSLEQVTSAQRTLQSLAQLLGKISNIVINDEVGAGINSAVQHIQVAEELLRMGDLLSAYDASLVAFKAAETAFTEPSLLALLYFPDDQKYAIYIPLFLPIMFPVVLSLKNLILWFRGKPIKKEKTE